MKQGTADCRSAIFLQPITHPVRHQELLVRIARPARFAANAACLGIRSPAMCLCHQLTNSTPFSARGRLLAQTPGACEMCIWRHSASVMLGWELGQIPPMLSARQGQAAKRKAAGAKK